MIKIAVYGKGGIGKSTTVSNVAAALAEKGMTVMQIGCDPKAESTIQLRHGREMRTVLDLYNEKKQNLKLEDMTTTGYQGVICVEAGGPTPGLGCAGRGIITALEKLKETGAYETYKPDIVLYHHFRRKYGDSCRSKHRHGGAEFQKSRLCISWRHYSEPAECQTGRRKSAGTGR